MNTPKITKRDYFNAIISLANGGEVTLDPSDIVAFCEKELASLDKRAETAKARAAAKREAGDELQALVLSVLTDEPATRAEVYDRVMELDGVDPETSLAKVGYRLTALVSSAKALKSDVSVTAEDGKSKKLAAYSLA